MNDWPEWIPRMNRGMTLVINQHSLPDESQDPESVG